MNSYPSKIFISLLLFIIAIMIVGCTAPATAPATNDADTPTAEMSETDDTISQNDDELATVRVGYIPITIFAPLFVANDKGYFADEGITLEMTPMEGGPENVIQVAAGNFDAAGSGIGAGMLNAIDRGIEFEIVAPLHTERPPLTSPFVVSKSRYDSGELTTMADMAGKTVSVNSKGAATEYWLWNALQQGGVDFPDVEVLGVAYRDVTPALENGSLDGAILSEPLATLMEDRELVTRISEDFIDNFTPTYMFFNKEWATSNPELAEGFVKAYTRGARDLNGDAWFSDENLAIIEAYTSVPVDVIARANRSYHDPNSYIPVEDIENLEDFFRSLGELSYEEDLDLSPMVNSVYAEAAVDSLGGPVEWE